MVEYGMETSNNCPARKSSKPNHLQENWCLQCFGTHKAHSGTLSGEGHNNKLSTVHWDAYWQAEACNSKQMPKTTLKKYYVVARQCLSIYCCPHCWNTPQYSPDLAPFDYHLFGPLKEALRSRRFTSDQELKEAVHALLTAQLKIFFSESIRKLVQRWTKCVEKQGDYVEKWC